MKDFNLANLASMSPLSHIKKLLSHKKKKLFKV